MPRRLLRLNRRGASAAEFALAAPVLILVLLATFDIANHVQLSIRLERVARAGAQYAAANPADGAAIRAAAISAWPALTAADVAVSCACASVAMTSCAAACPMTSSRTVSVTARRSTSPMLLQAMAQGNGHAVVRLR